MEVKILLSIIIKILTNYDPNQYIQHRNDWFLITELGYIRQTDF